MKKICLILLLLINVIAKLAAQSYDFRHYQVEQGLSYNSVFDITQDSKGFLWFASKDGLNRFDGYSFKIFRNEPADTNSIGSNVTLSVFEDQQKELWIGTSKGLFQYNDTTERFKIVPFTRDKYISSLKSDGNNNICFISDSKIFKYNKTSGEVSLYSDKQNFNVSSMLFLPDGTLWLSTNDGLLKKYMTKSDSFVSYDLFSHSPGVTSRWVDKIYATKTNAIFVGTSHQGVKLFDLVTLNYKDVLTYNKDRTAIFAKNFIHYDGDIYWIATESGIFVYNIKTGEHQQLRKSPGNPYALSDNAVYTFAKDKEGGIWVGTYFGGVNYYPKPFSAFDRYFPKSDVYPISGNAVREITADQFGGLWVGTEDVGLNKITKTVKMFLPDGTKTSIAHTNIHGLLATGNELWIGTYEQGLDVMDVRTGMVLRHYDKGNGPNDLKSNFVESIYETKSGEILLGSSYGIYKYNRLSDNFSLLNGFPDNYHYLTILEDDKGTIWAGTINNGLYFVNYKNGKSGAFRYVKERANSISDNFINSIFLDKDKKLWVTTENGLNKFDSRTNTFQRFGTKDGFPSNVFYCTEQDDFGYLWLSTSRGLAKFNPKTDEVKVFTQASGLLSDQFNYNSSFKDANGKLYFGSVNGMIAFNPTKFTPNQVIPNVFITGFQVFNQEVLIDNKLLKKSITYTDKIKLAYDQSTFSIDFAALVYTGFETAQYAYKLEGLDKEYTYLKRNRKVFYTKLSPGTYTFLVKGANSSGIWNSKPAKLIIVISPPFWLSIWAYILYLIILVAGIYYGIVYLNHRAKLKNKNKIEALESQKEREVYQARVDSFTHLITIAQSKPDQALLNKLNDYIHQNLSNTNLDVDLLAESLNMSRATFYRKIKAISNLTPNELINITRLKKAAELLLNSSLKIQQIANQTGFSSQAQFGRSFTKQFGVPPSEYAQSKRTLS
ncbi:ligand-binding sensor domain-containing protein/AraC-like DNA-binding protein [Pedobacter sp. UYP24]